MRRIPTIEVTIPTSSDCLQHDPLLDVQLKKCLNVVAPRRREAIRIAADAAQRFAKPLASRFGQTEHPGVERADHGATSDAR
jgi:hypothetical protein